MGDIASLFVVEDDTPAKLIRVLDAQRFADWCAQGGAHIAWAKNNHFSGKAGQILYLPDSSGGIDSILLGVANNDDNDAAFALAALSAQLDDGDVYRLAEDTPEAIYAHAALAWGLGAYAFDGYKSDKTRKSYPRLMLAPAHITKAAPLLRGIYLARDLINTPACDMLPHNMKDVMAQLADEHNALFSYKSGDALLAENLNMLHAVGRAAASPPHLLDMQWGAKDAPLITLVGKGVCFDSGGLNLKSGAAMALMKKDMGGAAIALGLAAAIMAADLPVRLRVLIGAVENAIGADAFRAGDILHSHKGLSVEIGNTDAEGRLVLADLLSLATQEETPEIIFDFATLTGAARTALGPDLAPFYTYDDTIAEALAQAGQAVYDPLWRMPLWAHYKDWLKSDIADINHIGSSAMAGSITAALFLAHFVPKAQKWVHFDVYGWQAQAKAGRAIGGAAQSLQAVFHYLNQTYHNEGL